MVGLVGLVGCGEFGGLGGVGGIGRACRGHDPPALKPTIFPGVGESPDVPTRMSTYCRPDAVVMVSPLPGCGPVSVKPLYISTPSVAARAPTIASPPTRPKRRLMKPVRDSTGSNWLKGFSAVAALAALRSGAGVDGLRCRYLLAAVRRGGAARGEWRRRRWRRRWRRFMASKGRQRRRWW